MANYDPREQARLEELEIKRKRQQLKQASLEDAAKEEIFADSKAEQVEAAPMTFKKKVENFWYHYALITVILAGSIALIIGLGKHFLFQPKYDLTVAIVLSDNYPLTLTDEALGEKLAPYVEDMNGDGKQTVAIERLVIPTGDAINAETHMAQAVRLQVNVEQKQSFIFLVDPPIYEYLTEQGLTFAPWDEVLPAGSSALSQAQEDRFDVSSHSLLGTLQEDLSLLMLFRAPDTPETTEDALRQEQEMAFAERLCEEAPLAALQ